MSRPEPISRRNRPAKPALSRTAIVDAALRLLDADGLDAVSMRRVAQALDTGPASLYVYVANREELLALLYNRAIGEVDLSDGDGDNSDNGTDWRERLTTLVIDTIEVLGRHRGIATVGLANVPTDPNVLAHNEKMLELLRRSGITEQTRAWAVDLIGLFVSASATEQSLLHERGAAWQAEDGVKDQLRTTFASLPEDRYPNLVALSGPLLVGSGPDRARWSIQVLLNGILATSATTSATTPS
jgi:AcrR family transcriptional regulator